MIARSRHAPAGGPRPPAEEHPAWVAQPRPFTRSLISSLQIFNTLRTGRAVGAGGVLPIQLALGGTAYGLTWLVALIVTILTYLWGLFVIIPGLRAMDRAPLNADGTPTPELEAATNRVKKLVSLELLGFFVIFTCMILMRFGL